MAKRFIDSKIWSDPWFQEIDVVSKLFWIYLFSICDIIGIWEYNPKRAEFDLCKRLPWDDIKKNLEEKVLFVDRYWIIKNFIKQQYPKLAESPNAPLHISVLKQIKKKCLNFDLNSLSIDYRYPIDSLQVIVKEDVRENVRENEDVQEGVPGEKPKKKKAYIFICPDHLADVWPKYVEMRDKIKKPLTDEAKRLAIEKLNNLSIKHDVQIKIIEQSIFNSWQGLFELKSDFENKTPAGRKLNEYEIGAASKYDGM